VTGVPISRARLRAWLIDALSAACALDPSEVDIERPVREYGLTSRDSLRLVSDLEDLLDVELPSTMIWQHSTVSALLDALLAQPSGTGQDDTLPLAASRVVAPAEPTPHAAEPVAVIGIGCRLPGGVHGPERFWRLLADGGNTITPLPEERWAQFRQDSPEQLERLATTTRWGGFLDDVRAFDADFFGITPREAVAMDPQQRLLLEVVREAFEHAGLAADRLRGSATGVFVGISGNEYGQLTFGDVSRVDAWTATGAAMSITANRLSYAFDLRGPSIALDTACSSSLVAVHMAAASLRSGESDLAVAGGVNLLLSPGVTASMDAMGVTSPDGQCRAFDASANGIVRAEGVGVVVLKPLSAALRDGDRVLAVLRGSAVNSDGRSNGLAAPNPDAQRALLRSAYAAAGVDPADVDYVEAHGTGTLVGDPIEASALGAVLGRDRQADRPLLVGSVKTNLGHLEAAAGVVGLIKVVLALANRRIPASLHYTEPNPQIPFGQLNLAVAAQAQPWPDRGRRSVAGVSGFGFGGTNAHVVVEQAPAVAQPAPPTVRPHQFLLGAASPARLTAAAAQLADWLAPQAAYSPADLEHTMARRASGRIRAVVTARTGAQLIDGLHALASPDPDVPGVTVDRGDRVGPGPVWVFSGHGSQWSGMGSRLLAEEPAFAAAVADVDAALRAETPLSFRAVLESGIEPAAFEDLQPVIFGLQVALARLWQHYGVQPAAVIGHSLGEVAAAVVAGAISLADGARIVVCRSRLLATTAGLGAMAVLELPPDEIRVLLRDYPAVDIAVFNSPGHTAVAGARDQVHALVAMVESRGLLAKLINSTVAGHCALVDDAAAALGRRCPDVGAKPPSVLVYPTAVDDPHAPVVFNTDYWVTNVRRPVRFAQAVTAALQDGYSTFVEVSPHPVLRLAITETAAAHRVEATVLGTLRRCDDETWQFHTNLGALVAAGHTLPHVTGTLVDLPTTPWQHTEHWLPPAPRTVPPGTHPLLGVHVELPDSGTHVWEADLGSLSHPWLADHRIGGRPILAASCFVEMAFVAASTALRRTPGQLALVDLSLHHPLPLADRTSVTTTFTTEGAGGRVHVHSKDGEGAWILHCSVLVTQPGGTVQQPPPMPRQGERLTHEALYHRLRSLGVDYGPAFAGVTDVYATQAGAVATVGVPDEAPRAGYHLHPVLLDSCLQCLAATLPADESANALYMPVEFGSVRLSGDPALGVEAQVRALPAEPGAAGVVGEVRLLDEDGRVLLEVTGVFLRRVRAAELHAPLREVLLRHEWQPLAARGGTAGPVLLVADDGHPLLEPALAGFAARGVPVTVASGPADVPADRPTAVALLVADDGTPDGLAAGQRAVLAAADWTRALAALPGRPPRLWLVTSAAATVLPGDTGRPGPAALRGLVRVLSYEHPALQVSWLDLDPADPGRALATELASGAADDEVAWRAERRYVARLVRTPAPERGTTLPIVRPDGGYVVTGGLGGLGLLLAGWLVDGGAGTVVLNGRSAPGPAATAVLEELRAAGATIEVVLGDIAEDGVAQRVLAAAGNVRGVVHAAAVFDDATVSTLDENTLRKTWLPKAYGAWRLHDATKDIELDWWLGFSSATALHGLPGQPAYASANAYLDAVVAARRAAGLPATSINWGTWAEVGAAAGIDVPWLNPISPDEGLTLLSEVLAAGVSALGAVRLNTVRLAAEFPDLAAVPFFAGLLPVSEPGEATGWPGVRALLERPPAEVRELVADQLRYRIASVMGLRAADLAADRPLTGLGVDSLLAMRIRNAVQHDFELNLPVSVLLRGASLDELSGRMCHQLGLADESPAAVADPVLVPPRDAAERLVASAWQDVLDVPVGVTHDFGGDDEQAERITALVSSRSGHEFARATLFARPTIELMAKIVRDADRDTGPVRVLRENGTWPPVFFFHPGGGDTAVFHQLVDLLEPAVTAYGFDRIDETVTVEQRITRCLPELRRIQPTGPYRLAGWSFGGFLAYEMAQQLTAAGDRVEVLALIDPILPLPQETGLTDVELTERRFRRFGEFLETSYGKRIELPYEDLARLGDEEQADLLVATILAADIVDKRVSEAILTHQRRSFLDARLLERYQPEPYRGRAVFYSAAVPVPGGLRDPRFDRTDPARGWDAVCPDLEVVNVPGHHLALLDPPNVEVIARHLAGVLGRAPRRN
jgi:phthiocerol/phenolphthiocerol synthesis type-I polyketide synthase D